MSVSLPSHARSDIPLAFITRIIGVSGETTQPISGVSINGEGHPGSYILYLLA